MNKGIKFHAPSTSLEDYGFYSLGLVLLILLNEEATPLNTTYFPCIRMAASKILLTLSRMITLLKYWNQLNILAPIYIKVSIIFNNKAYITQIK